MTKRWKMDGVRKANEPKVANGEKLAKWRKDGTWTSLFFTQIWVNCSSL